MIPPLYTCQIMAQLAERFGRLYGPDTGRQCVKRLNMMIGRYGIGVNAEPHPPQWDQTDSLLITYGDMVQTEDEAPLATLKTFLDRYVGKAVRHLHLLPFFPYSSDDGFSVIDYLQVNPDLGRWRHIQALGDEYRLMFDLVLNHVSSQGAWFQQYAAGVAPFRHYFIEADPETDLSAVVRPRNHPLLTRTPTRNGERWVWTTFSEDQVDLDFSNPDVLFEFLDILFFYLSKGARTLRLDAIAYLWKEIGTSSIHLHQTHEVVKIFRDVADMLSPGALILTETNVPHAENISYFGGGSEAHMVYQFTLPPLLLHGLQTDNASHLTQWAADLPPPPAGCTFLNFTASHDGIGVRPLEGILPPEDLEGMLTRVTERGGFVSTKRNSDGSESPYELNITYFDALTRPADDDPDMDIARYLCSQAVPLALQGIPGLYFNSLIAARNNSGGVEFTGLARTINREKWQLSSLESTLADEQSRESVVFKAYIRLLNLRAQHPAFHPDASQTILDLGPDVFALARTAPSDEETIVALHNFTPGTIDVLIDQRVPQLAGANQWRGLISGAMRGRAGRILRMKPYEVCWLLAPNVEG